jgi:hypothetical protein
MELIKISKKPTDKKLKWVCIISERPVTPPTAKFDGIKKTVRPRATIIKPKVIIRYSFNFLFM